MTRGAVACGVCAALILAPPVHALDIEFPLGAFMQAGMAEITGTVTDTGMIFDVTAGDQTFRCDEFADDGSRTMAEVTCRASGRLAGLDVDAMATDFAANDCRMSFGDAVAYGKARGFGEMDIRALRSSLANQGAGVYDRSKTPPDLILQTGACE